MEFWNAVVGIVAIGCGTGIICTVVEKVAEVKRKGRDQELKLAQERLRMQELQVIEMRRQTEALQRQLEWHDKLLTAQARADQLHAPDGARTPDERVAAAR